MESLEVLIDGKSIGIYTPPDGASFTAMVSSVPKTHMRAQILSGNDQAHWQWQLPDIEPGQTISFRLVEALPGSGVPPRIVEPRDRKEVAETKRMAAKAAAEAQRVMVLNKRKPKRTRLRKG